MRAPGILIVLLKLVMPALVTVTVDKPLGPFSVITPMLNVPVPASKVRVSALPPIVPLVVPVTVNAPFAVDSVGVAASAITKLPPMLKVLFVVLMLLARLTLPVVLKPPAAEMLPVEFLVKVPLFVTETAPVEVKLLFTANVVPRSVADPTLTVLLKVVAPVAAFV